MLSEKYNNRTYPLIAGQLILIGSQIMLMEAPKYWVMIIARILQGVSSSMIWVVGLALLYECMLSWSTLNLLRIMALRCDTCPERIVGSETNRRDLQMYLIHSSFTGQLGMAMTGLSLG